jgi:predicted dehydrogenase
MTAKLSVPWPVPYQPQVPKDKSVGIGVIGCGGITRGQHIPAYKAQGFRIVAVADISEENAKKAAEIAGGVPYFTDHRKLLERKDVQVVDAATHPSPRMGIIRDALNAGKDVLSQKPFVLDLKDGRELVALAKKKKKLLAVNQNGRWAPPWKVAQEWIRTGAIGDVMTVRHHCHWNHNWVAGRSFDKLKHVILYDYSIHWFDITCCWLAGHLPKTILGANIKAPNQKALHPLLAHAAADYGDMLASWVFDASCVTSQPGEFRVEGTKGTLVGNEVDSIELRTSDGVFKPQLQGKWFPDGFKGTMGELLCAREEGRQPSNSAEDNLRSLQLCFAACQSADRGNPVTVASIEKLPKGNVTA